MTFDVPALVFRFPSRREMELALAILDKSRQIPLQPHVLPVEKGKHRPPIAVPYALAAALRMRPESKKGVFSARAFFALLGVASSPRIALYMADWSREIVAAGFSMPDVLFKFRSTRGVKLGYGSKFEAACRHFIPGYPVGDPATLPNGLRTPAAPEKESAPHAE